MLLIGTTVAGLPTMIQVLMAGAMQLDPAAFPRRHNTLADARFWPGQIVVLCVAVALPGTIDLVWGRQPEMQIAMLDVRLISLDRNGSLLDAGPEFGDFNYRAG